MKTVAIINQKGGVGKSTTALALGAGLRRKKKKVLFVDLDAQGNLTYSLGFPANSVPEKSTMELLDGAVGAEESIVQAPGGDVIPSSPVLSGADKELTAIGKEFRLKEALQAVSDRYDYVIIDTPPALGILTINALTACDCCIVPAQADIFSLQGILQLNSTIQAVLHYCNPSLRIAGILLTRYNGRAVIGREIAEKLRETAAQMQTRVFKTTIREGTAIKEAQAMQESIYDYAPRSNVGSDYASFVDEFLKEERKHG